MSSFSQSIKKTKKTSFFYRQQEMLSAINKGEYKLVLFNDHKPKVKKESDSWFRRQLDQVKQKTKVPVGAPNAGPHSNNTHSPISEGFLSGVVQIIISQLDNYDLSVDDLCEELRISYMQFYRKIKSLTGKTPVQFIRSVRLTEGRNRLESSDLNISEIAYDVGFNDPNYFTRAFHQEFGISPSSFRA